MFEDSFVEAQAAHASTAKRWTMVGSTALQAVIAVTLITLPLLHPERLYLRTETPLVFTPPPPKPPLPRVIEQQQTASSSSTEIPTETRTYSTLIPHGPIRLTDDPPAMGPVHIAMGGGDGLPSGFMGADTNGSRVTIAKPDTPKRVSISTGVSAGMLLSPIHPVYPAIARSARISGTVVVEAVISKAGVVESLKVISGPEMLRGAALDALRTARYRPYLLNGEPTEVQTTFTVNFKLDA